MTTGTSMFRPALAAAAIAALVLAAPPAAAESRREADLTPLGLLRGSEAAVLAVGVAPTEAPPAAGVVSTLRVDEVLSGAPIVAAGAALPLAGGAEDGPRLPAGIRCVAFLKRLPDGRWEAPAGSFGVIAIGEAPPGAVADPVVALFRDLAPEVGTEGRLERPIRVRAALVRGLSGPARLRAGAALDLLREPGLLEALPDAERDAIVAAFDATPSRDRGRVHLARLVGRIAAPDAGRRLADALLGEDGVHLRSAVGAALGDLRDPAAVRVLAERASAGDAEARARAAAALGASGLPEARPPVEALLGAAEPRVRLEAAVALGRLRLADAVPALLRRFRGVPGGPVAEPDPAVRRALAWALGRCDAPEAWEALRAAADDASESARAFAAEVLKDPARDFVP